MYGKYGAQTSPTQKDYDFKSINLWEDGEAIFLLKKKMKSNEFSLLMIGQGETTYHLTCHLVKEERHSIKNNDHIY